MTQVVNANFNVDEIYISIKPRHFIHLWRKRCPVQRTSVLAKRQLNHDRHGPKSQNPKSQFGHKKYAWNHKKAAVYGADLTQKVRESNSRKGSPTNLIAVRKDPRKSSPWQKVSVFPFLVLPEQERHTTRDPESRSIAQATEYSLSVRESGSTTFRKYDCQVGSTASKCDRGRRWGSCDCVLRACTTPLLPTLC